MTEPYIGMPITLGGGCAGSALPPGRPPAMPPGNGGNNSGNDSNHTGGGTSGSNTGSNPPQRPNPPAGQPTDLPAFDTLYLGSLPLAMTYTPMQQWKSTYSDSVSLSRGTIFPELDLPFEGKTILTERAKGGHRQ